MFIKYDLKICYTKESNIFFNSLTNHINYGSKPNEKYVPIEFEVDKKRNFSDIFKQLIVSHYNHRKQLPTILLSPIQTNKFLNVILVR